MNFKKLKSKISKLEEKYSFKQNQVLNYYNDLLDAFYEYADSNNNTNYEFEDEFRDIVTGEDCAGLVADAKPAGLYLWKSNNKETSVSEIKYKDLVNLSKDALKCYEKNKRNDLDIC